MGFDLLQADNLSGASEILARTVEYWLDEIETLQSPSLRLGLESIRNRGLFIIRHFPRMAPLFHLVNNVLIAIKDVTSIQELQTNAKIALEKTVEKTAKAKSTLISSAQELVGTEQTIFVYSRSGIILSILKELLQRNPDLNIVLTEARPMNEGRSVAQELLQAGFNVTMYIDAAMQEAVEQCDLILIGADSFSEKIVVNKIGTKGLALLAREADKPIYCITTTDKYLPTDIQLPNEKDHPSHEVWPDAPPHLHIRNKYFENIPLRLLTDVMTEEGSFKKGDRLLQRALKIDDWLRQHV